jgi:hypothetical protein
MPNDHRGNPVGNPATSHGGHRPTPRVNQALQRYYKIDADTAQEVIDEHRKGNDYLDDAHYGVEEAPHGYYSAGKTDFDNDNVGNRIDHIPTAISEAVDARSGKNSMGYSSPYEYPPTVKYKESKDPAEGIFY